MYADLGNNQHVDLWTFTNGDSFGWAKGQLNVPMVSYYADIVFKVVQDKPITPGRFAIPFVAFDDITIKGDFCNKFGTFIYLFLLYNPIGISLTSTLQCIRVYKHQGSSIDKNCPSPGAYLISPLQTPFLIYS